jgi:hypothetical protein
VLTAPFARAAGVPASARGASPPADLDRMAPPLPRMAREEGLSGAVFLSVVSLAVNAVLALAVFSMGLE